MTEAPVPSGKRARYQELPPRPLRERAALAALLLGALFALAAAFGPWLVVVTSGSTPAAWTDVRDYGVSGWSATDSASGVTASPSGSYLPWPAVGPVFLSVSVITWLAVLVGFAALGLAWVAPFRPRGGRIPFLLGFASAAFAIVGPLIFLVLFPSAATSAGLLPAGAGLWGMGSVGSTTRTWGAGWAWNSLVGAFALYLIGGVLVPRDSPPIRATAATVPA